MTKIEFLKKLREALETEVSPAVLQENLDYYNGYIEDEIRRGRSEGEVTETLGDPWAIARTIIDMAGPSGQSSYVYDAEDTRRESKTSTYGSVYVHTFDSWWKKLLLILFLGGVVFLILAVISGLVSLIAPIIVPVLIAVLIYRILRRSGQ